MPKTPLRYPGGKSRAIDVIMPHIRSLDCGELCSPFLGGGSIELKCAEEGMTVHGYDLFQPLVWFWEALLSNPKKLAEYVNDYRGNVRDYADPKVLMRDITKECKPQKCLAKGTHDVYCAEHANLLRILEDDLLGFGPRKEFNKVKEAVNNRRGVKSQDKLFAAAAEYYLINRTSFSGNVSSGGWSWKASWARLTQSNLDRLREFTVTNFSVSAADFKDSIAAHPEAGLYLDPPYCLNVSDLPVLNEDGEPVNQEILYGNEGDHHEGLDHTGLAAILKARDKWVLSYNDCKYIRKLYKGYKIIDVDWAYGMKNVKARPINPKTGKPEMGESSEILIIG